MLLAGLVLLTVFQYLRPETPYVHVVLRVGSSLHVIAVCCRTFGYRSHIDDVAVALLSDRTRCAREVQWVVARSVPKSVRSFTIAAVGRKIREHR